MLDSSFTKILCTLMTRPEWRKSHNRDADVVGGNKESTAFVPKIATYVMREESEVGSRYLVGFRVYR